MGMGQEGMGHGARGHGEIHVLPITLHHPCIRDISVCPITHIVCHEMIRNSGQLIT